MKSFLRHAKYDTIYSPERLCLHYDTPFEILYPISINVENQMTPSSNDSFVVKPNGSAGAQTIHIGLDHGEQQRREKLSHAGSMSCGSTKPNCHRYTSGAIAE